MDSVILITGAAGKTGRELVRQLADRGIGVRAMVFRPEQAEEMLALGAREALVGDSLKPADLLRCVDGVRAVYHICPNVHPSEVEIGDATIAAARSGGVDRFVFHSVLYPDVEAMPHHWLKFRVEQKLKESGLAFTILRPCAYMQNGLARIPSLKERGKLEVPYDAGAEFSLVDLGDVATAAAVVLLEPGHEGRTYELCGSESISHHRMAREWGIALGRPVEAVAIDPAEWEMSARSSGLGDYAIDALLKMFLWYDRNGFAGSSTDLESLLSRPPTTFAEFLQGAIES
ncbi:NmrA family NAD(P)-binding protein [Gemmatimonadota bacterium]